MDAAHLDQRGRRFARGLAWVALVGYYAATVLLHEEVQAGLRHLIHRWSYAGFELRMAGLWVALAGPLLALLALRLLRLGRRRELLLLAGWILAVALVDYLWLFSQSERIHYPQYALLALGLRALLWPGPAPGSGPGRDLLVLGLCGVLGFLDEGYQASVLYAHRPELPLDLKDVGLNLLGATLGLLLHRARAAASAPDSAGEPG